MASDRVILAFDTSAAHCAAALRIGGRIATVIVEPMARGQAENLPSILDATLAQAGIDWRDLTDVAVGTGPGNFTGIRISVSLARGLALARQIPAFGITQFEAAWHGHADLIIATVTAPRDQVYFAASNAGLTSARLGTLDQAHDMGLPVIAPLAADTLIENIAHVAATRQHMSCTRPTPFYIKPADAAPSRDQAPARLS